MSFKSPGNCLTSRRILEMFENNIDEKELLLSLTSTNNLEYFMNKSDLKWETISAFVHIVSTALGGRGNADLMLRLLCDISDSSLLGFDGLSLLQQYDEHLECFHPLNCLLDDFILIIQQLFMRTPSSAITPQTIGLIDFLNQKIITSDSLVEKETKLNNVSKLRQDIIHTLTEKAKCKTISKVEEDFEDKLLPPDDFRRLPIIPSDRDVFEPTEFLRRNKSKGQYLNLEHYLDVQFRLYREDFICPLRSAVKEYMQINQDENQPRGRHIRLEDGRLYRNVQILGTTLSPEFGSVYEIKLDYQHVKKINWFTSKRLIYGSLVCLSFDNFRTVLFAVIVDSDRNHLERLGIFKAQIFTTRNHQNIPRNINGVMIESSSAYFESYRHVLAALKKVKGQIPFKRYIVDCERDIFPPSYIREGSHTYNFKPITKQSDCVNIMNIEEWPSMDDLHLDAAQWEAFHAALTKEFVVIQGPPGTGKTHIGLQIAKILLYNKRVWSDRNVLMDEHMLYRRIPDDEDMFEYECKNSVMVVCFTNHALDQFLEGIIKFQSFIPKEDIVRIGSRCKNPSVEKFTLFKHRSKFLSNYRKTAYKLQRMKNIDSNTITLVDRLKSRMMQIKSRLTAIQNKHIVLGFIVLKTVISSDHRKEFGEKPDKKFYRWLQVTEEFWYQEVEKIYQGRPNGLTGRDINNHITDDDAVYIDITSEAEFEYAERHIEDDEYDEAGSTENLGLDIIKQLKKNEKKNIEERCRDVLRNEAEKVKQNIKFGEKIIKETAEIITNLWELTLEDRWKFYRFWVSEYIKSEKQQLLDTEELISALFDRYKKAKLQIDELIMSKASVIALTTTAAARYYDSLAKLKPTITIIEEAAEVLEAHIVTALSQNCQHVILIGDHKQLEPKPAVYELAVKYNLSVSLFERMINNDLHYYCLQRQHRMRPDIADLVRHIYPTLEDNENVTYYEDVRGIRQNLYFINHSSPEVYSDDGRSYSNEFEAEYAKELCRYLLNQGYKPSQITILAAYSGQMYCIQKKMPKAEFEGVTICVLDNYQGEENEVIILSLVRSNQNEGIGFLNKENRICVALSRAKKGLYIIGNIDTLTKKSKHWQVISNKLKSKNGIGKGLFLYCQNHPEKQEIQAISPLDFLKAPDGGCGILCEFRLDCGHACRFRCHNFDRDHTEYKCMKNCPRTCPDEHQCRRRCHEPNPCECSVQIEKQLPCGHINLVKCYMEPSEHKCNTEVERLLKCGHTAIMHCHTKVDSFKCKEKVIDTRSKCSHEYEKECHKSKRVFEDEIKCLIQTEKTFKTCKHKIIVGCQTDLDKINCKEYVTKKFNCGHTVEVVCYLAKNVTCKEKCTKVCDKLHVCNRICHYPTPCNCSDIIERVISGCQHVQKMACSEDLNTFECLEIVHKTLPTCGHVNKVECYKNPKEICCSFDIKKKMPNCQHEQILPCSVDPVLDHVRCMSNVDVYLKTCGHSLSVKCWESKEEREESALQCNVAVPYTYSSCNHTTNIPCSMKQVIDKIDTAENPMNTIDIPLCCLHISQKLPCGHSIQIECHRAGLPIKCTSKCQKLLSCGHICTHLCIECQDGMIHKICQRKCEKEQLCGHKCNGYNCLHCKPCNKPCTYACDHRKCTNTCSQPCKPCKQPCVWQCPHSKCSKLCSEICDRQKCSQPCKTILGCGHICSGYCGEPCPDFCIECKPNQVPDDRSYLYSKFCKTVTLKDCGHTFMDTILDAYMRKSKDALVIKCPTCKTIIHKHPRYDRVLKCKKQFMEEAKSKILERNTGRQITFPCYSGHVAELINTYLKRFATYRQIVKYLNYDQNFVDNLSFTTCIANRIHDTVNRDLSHIHSFEDLFQEIYKLHTLWVVTICSSKPDVLEAPLDDERVAGLFKDSKKHSHLIDTDVLLDIKHDSFTAAGARPKDTTKTTNISINGNDVVNLIKTRIVRAEYDHQHIDELLSLLITSLDRIEEDAHLINAKSYPVLRDKMGIHQDEWAICRKGHIYSITNDSITCCVCREAKTKKQPKESVAPDVTKLDFQKDTRSSQKQIQLSWCEIRNQVSDQTHFKQAQDRSVEGKEQMKESRFAINERTVRSSTPQRRPRGNFRGRCRSANEGKRGNRSMSLNDFITPLSSEHIKLSSHPNQSTGISDESQNMMSAEEQEDFPTLTKIDRKPEGNLKFYCPKKDNPTIATTKQQKRKKRR
ncbi:NFX1-type zinc finger-containing protein 1-like [Mytilus californianus]|uniref:NFX1-type zinc finger-containing protein 1-like n=1 Tax=Mytilus californianus TaxID=6549 RepID=UPI002247DC95|nr:NFX1-type zinc finger-containing protein 1-like [Mytilus californianus]XP_052100558.1 NFX1-type zinc finger-containing protein 1-like [Mytilus californianus]